MLTTVVIWETILLQINIKKDFHAYFYYGINFTASYASIRRLWRLGLLSAEAF
jgi:hypothetical protein